MLNRLRWIVVSYITRPILLGLVAVAIVIAISNRSAIERRDGYRIPYQIPTPHWELPVNSIEALQAVRASGRESEVDEIDLTTLWSSIERHKRYEDRKKPNEEFYRVLQEFPNLRGVTYSAFFDWSGLEQISKCLKLESVCLQGATSPDFAQLRSLTHLKSLQLTITDPLDGIEALNRLPHLQTIILSVPYPLSDRLLAQLGRFPRLKTLALDYHGMSIVPTSVSAAGFQALGKAPALRSIYLDGDATSQRGQLWELARASLPPSVDVQSSGDYYRAQKRLMQLIPVVILAAAIAMQLFSQFATVASRTLPGFMLPHLAIGVLLCLCVIAFAVQRLVLTGAFTINATLVSSTLVATVIAAGVDRTLNRLGTIRSRGAIVARWIVMAFSYAIFAAAFLTPQWLDPLFESHHGGLLSMLAAVSLAAWTLAYRGLQTLVEWKADAPILPKKQLWNSYSQVWPIFSKLREARIESWRTSGIVWSWWNRVHRWRMGNPPSLRTLLPAMILMSILPGGFSLLRQGDFTLPRAMMFQVGALCSAYFGLVSYLWRQRMPLLSLESLRPLSRHTFHRELIAAFVLDQLPTALVSATLFAVAMNLRPKSSVDWLRLPIDFAILFVAILALTLGVGSVIAVIRRAWLAAVIAIMTLYGVLLAISGMFALIYTEPSELSTQALEAQLWIPILVGGILSALMYRRWRDLEYGLLC